MPTLLWSPDKDRVQNSRLANFQSFLEEETGQSFEDYEALHRFSIDKMTVFWPLLCRFLEVKAETWGNRVLDNPKQMPGATFFPEAKINFAENLLVDPNDQDALVFWGEDQTKTRLSRKDLYDRVSQLVQYFDDVGLEKGDRVCALLPNMPQTVIAMLACAARGLIWSSTSPDFGVDGVLDRFGQIEPKLFFCVDGYYYNGKTHDVRDKNKEILSKIPSIRQAVQVNYVGLDIITDDPIDFDLTCDNFPAGDISFVPVEFNHPLFIMFSSGTTGKPKCIVHGTGGTLLKHVSEHALHGNMGEGSRIFFFSTCGWMMWNWLITALSQKSCVLLYDGSPFLNDGAILFDYVDAEKIEFFGCGAKFIDALNKAENKPAKTHTLSSLKTIASTGSPLIGASFDYIYQSIKADVQVASISGGTDILGCFVLGNPYLPVYRGEIQSKALGMAVDVFDDDAQGLIGQKGELVCTKPFPSMPVSFWNDEDGAKYKSAYFEKFENIWHHGDFVQINPETSGFEIFGRSDATLNPGGVRIGTAEIYRQVDTMDEIRESVVVGQNHDGDVRVVLFVILQDNVELDEALKDKIKKRIRSNCTPRHVPSVILPCPDIPRTKSGKISEICVRDLIHGDEIKNKGALANPETLNYFANLDF